MMMDIYHNFHFLRPLWLLSLLPVFLLWRALYRNQDSHAAWKNLIAPHLLKHLIVEHNQQARIRPIHLLLVVWGLIAISLSGPTWKREPSPFAEDSAGMIILLKVAPSMMAEDVQPFRLERARQKLHDLLEMRQGAATGLIAYSGSAHLVMPPTRDGRIVNIMANGLAPDIMPVEGDALLEALQMASTLFKQTGSAGSIVALADSVSPEQVLNLDRLQYSAPFPLQFLSVNAIGVKMDRGLSDFSMPRVNPGSGTEPTTVEIQATRTAARAVAGNGNYEICPSSFIVRLPSYLFIEFGRFCK